MTRDETRGEMKRPKSPGGSCPAVSFIRKPQRDMDNLCVPKTSSGDDFGFRREDSLFPRQNSLFLRIFPCSVA